MPELSDTKLLNNYVFYLIIFNYVYLKKLTVSRDVWPPRLFHMIKLFAFYLGDIFVYARNSAVSLTLLCQTPRCQAQQCHWLKRVRNVLWNFSTAFFLLGDWFVSYNLANSAVSETPWNVKWHREVRQSTLIYVILTALNGHIL